MSEMSSRTKRNIGLGLVAVLCLWFSWTVRTVLNPLVVAYVLAFMVHPFVLRLERKGVSRMRAVNTIYALAAIVGLILMMGFWSQGSRLFGRVLSQAQNQEGGLFTNLDERFAAFTERHKDKSWMSWLQEEFSEEDPNGGAEREDRSNGSAAGGPGGPERDSQPQGESINGDAGSKENGVISTEPIDGTSSGAQEIDKAVPELGAPAGDPLAGEVAGDPDGTVVDLDPVAKGEGDNESLHLIPALQRLWNQVVLELDPSLAGSAARRGANVVGSWFGSFFGLLSMLVLLPIYTWFLLFELERIHAFIRRYIPEGERARYTELGRKIGAVLTNFLRGQLVVCLLKGLTITVGLFITGIPYALFLGLTAGFAALIPFFGASLAAVFTFLVGLMEPNLDLVPLLWRTVLVFGIAELLEGYVFVPRIIGGTLGLHPLVVLVAVLAGGAAMGMFGFLIALPLVASLVIVAKELVMPALQEWADEPDVPETPPGGGVA